MIARRGNAPPPGARRRLPRSVLLTLAVVMGAAAIWELAGSPPAPARSGGPPQIERARTPLAEQGRTLFVQGCASCHGYNARGTVRAPSLYGVGPGPPDWYLRSGRMPLANPNDYPARTKPAYDEGQIRALVSYVGSLGHGGVPIPAVDTSKGNLAEGLRIFTQNCAGCHQVIAQGGIATPNVVAPPLGEASATQVGEVIRFGPYLMPAFSHKQISDAQVDSLARYVLYASRDPQDKGGWGIGHIGPIPEGMVAWLLAGLSLLIVIRLIGERTTR